METTTICRKDFDRLMWESSTLHVLRNYIKECKEEGISPEMRMLDFLLKEEDQK